MKFTRITSPGAAALGLAVTIVSILAPALSAFAQADTLAITENSHTSLTVVWNGTTLSAGSIALVGSADQWNITLPVAVDLGIGPNDTSSPPHPALGSSPSPGAAVALPGAPLGTPPWNNVFSSPEFTYSDVVNVTSDSPTTSAYALGMVDSVQAVAGYADVGGLYNEVLLTYTDLAGTNSGSGSVPDGGLTITMLGMAISGLALIRRKLQG
jgi:hypothetical protein